MDNLMIDNLEQIFDGSSGEQIALLAEFKISLNAYLKELVASPIRSLSDAIEFNKKNSKLVSDYHLFCSNFTKSAQHKRQTIITMKSYHYVGKSRVWSGGISKSRSHKWNRRCRKGSISQISKTVKRWI